MYTDLFKKILLCVIALITFSCKKDKDAIPNFFISPQCGDGTYKVENGFNVYTIDSTLESTWKDERLYLDLNCDNKADFSFAKYEYYPLGRPGTAIQNQIEILHPDAFVGGYVFEDSTFYSYHPFYDTTELDNGYGVELYICSRRSVYDDFAKLITKHSVYYEDEALPIALTDWMTSTTFTTFLNDKSSAYGADKTVILGSDTIKINLTHNYKNLICYRKIEPTETLFLPVKTEADGEVIQGYVKFIGPDFISEIWIEK